MRKLFTTTILLCVAVVTSFAQQGSISQIIKGENNLTATSVTLSSYQQVSFDPAKANTILGLNEKAGMMLQSAEPDELGFVHYRYVQSFQDIPIEDAMYVVHTKNGRMTGTSGEIVAQFDARMLSLSPVAGLTAVQAINAALALVGAKKYMWQNTSMENNLKEVLGTPDATFYPSTELVWYSPGANIDVKNLKLAYKVDVYAEEPLSHADYFIDAQTGALLGKKDEIHCTDATGTANTAYSGTQTVHSDLFNGSYRLRDYTKGKGVFTLHYSNSSDYTNASANWNKSGADQYALDAHYGVSQTYLFYQSNFNRNSIDNKGYGLYSFVNSTATVNNAYWDGYEMVYGVTTAGAGITAIDVTGHELTHGVTQNTSKLNYSNESGAINESMSDIMGKSVQFWSKPSDINWQLSNDMGWLIRDMSNPKLLGQPNTYKGINWYAGTADNGGVHTNSGVGNFMFYLLVAGGSGTNDLGNAYTVTGIGLTSADKILYRTETVYLTSTSNYTAWRTACVNAATDLFGAGSNEVIQVQNAWYAVGIGTAGGVSCGTPTNLGSSAITTNSATVSWGVVPGALTYNLQYQVSGAGTWATVSVSGVTTGLINLAETTTYNYRVQTVCSGGASSYSSTASFFTLTSCGIPSGLGSSDITTNSATVSWSTATGALSYNLQVKATSDITWTTIAIPSGTSTGLTGLAEATTYNYRVQTVCSAGPAAYSGFASFTTLASCGAPSGLGSSAVTVNSATVSWNAASGALSYNLQVQATSDVTWTTIAIPSGISFGLTSLSTTTTYNYRVQSICLSGPSTYSAPASFTTLTPCNSPSILNSSAITSGGATVGWSAAAGALTYNLQYQVSGAGTWTTLNTASTSAVLSLAASTTYNYRVQTVCSSGPSSYSANSSFTTLPLTITYCTSKGNTQSFEYIKTVSILSFTNTSGSNTGYGNFTALNIPLVKGAATSLTLTPGFSSTAYREYWSVYIDYNQNGAFTDANERVFIGNGTAAVTGSFTVSATALTGATRMRVIMQYGSTPASSCGTYSYGETEDYTVTIGTSFGFGTDDDITSVITTDETIPAIYPNPASGVVNIRLSNIEGIQPMVEIISVTGQKMISFAAGEKEEETRVDVSALPAGIYIVRTIYGTERLSTEKLVKQ